MMIRRILPMAAGLAILGASVGAQQTTPPTQPPTQPPRQPVQPPQTPPRDTTMNAARDTTMRPMGQMGRMDHEKMGMQRMDDRMILSTLAQGNDAEIKGAEQAIAKTRNGEVRTFAQMMQRDHSAANDKIIQISRTVSPGDSLDTPRTKMKRDDGEDRRGLYALLEPAVFDSVYAAQAVKDHRAKLEMIAELTPQAKDATVRTLLEEMRPTVSEHLRQAELLSTKVRGTRAQATIPSTRADTTSTPPASTTPPRNPRS